MLRFGVFDCICDAWEVHVGIHVDVVVVQTSDIKKILHYALIVRYSHRVFQYSITTASFATSHDTSTSSPTHPSKHQRPSH